MTTVNATQGVSGGGAGNVDGATSTVGATAGAPAAFLPDPVDVLTWNGDPGAELAALAVKSGEQQQANAAAARHVDQGMEVSEDNQQVAAMRQKAHDIEVGGIAEGLGMVAEGGFDAGSACASSPAGKVAHGGAKIAEAFFQGAAANDDASAAAAKSASDQAKTAADDDHDAKKSGGDLVSAALDFYKEYTSAQASAKSAALHRA